MKTTIAKCIFAVGFDEYGELNAYITPKDYFEKTGFLIDQHLAIPGFCWHQILEAVFETPTQDPEETYKSLIELGFTYSPDLSKFLGSKRAGGNKMYKPSI